MIDLRIRSTRRRRMCSCPHLKDFKKADGLKVFRKVHAHFVCCGSREARKRKVQGCKFPRWRSTALEVRCCDFMFIFFLFFLTQGELVLLPRMWNIRRPSPFLPSVRLFWLLHRKPAHSPSRAINWSFSRYENFTYTSLLPAIICPVHNNIVFFPGILALDLTHGVVYCFVCRDNVYDLDLEKIGVEQGRRAWKTLGKLCLSKCVWLATLKVFQNQLTKRLSK